MAPSLQSLIPFAVGTGILWGVAWLGPSIALHAAEGIERARKHAGPVAHRVAETPAVRRARAAASMAALKGSWSLKGGPRKKLQELAVKVAP